MKLLIALFGKLIQSLMVIAGLMALLFVGYLIVGNVGPTVRTIVEAPDALKQIKHDLRDGEEAIALRNAEMAEHQRMMERIAEEIALEEESLNEELRASLEALTGRAEEHKAHVFRTVEANRAEAARSLRAVEAQYCDSYNPLNWLTCRAIRERKAALEESVGLQREALTQAALGLEENARAQAEQLRLDGERALEARTAQMRTSLTETLDKLQETEADRLALEARLADLRLEEALIYEQHWIVLELKERWPGLLLTALLIFFAPYLRRTFWYFVGMSVVARAQPIELVSKNTPGQLQIGESARTIEVEIPVGGKLMARSGYIQSDKVGARTDILFDWKSPNLSYISGLVLLTRLESKDSSEKKTFDMDPLVARRATLGSPDDPDAYLMEISLENHPGLVLKARNVVAVTGNIGVRSSWRIKSCHAWATQQVRFLIFSGTGTIIIEGFGDVAALSVTPTIEGGAPCEKRMPLVIGFDARLQYRTRRAATFLPYLFDPKREPLVVDVFEGKGTFFYQKNPDSNGRRGGAQRVGDFFFDAIRRLLGV